MPNFEGNFGIEIMVLQKIYKIRKEAPWNVDIKTGLKIKNPLTEGEVMGWWKTMVKNKGYFFNSNLGIDN